MHAFNRGHHSGDAAVIDVSIIRRAIIISWEQEQEKHDGAKQ
jgi:hypothetical protein